MVRSKSEFLMDRETKHCHSLTWQHSITVSVVGCSHQQGHPHVPCVTCEWSILGKPVLQLGTGAGWVHQPPRMGNSIRERHSSPRQCPAKCDKGSLKTTWFFLHSHHPQALNTKSTELRTYCLENQNMSYTLVCHMHQQNQKKKHLKWHKKQK